MIRTLFIFLFSLAFFSLNAQQPILHIDGADSNRVRMSRLDLDVQIAGNIATTTMTMRFCNSSSRVLEGELTFPMPEGVSISRFALDMNGKMREAVPVEKEKGQVVFENIERQNVDPGLLEKVEGNSFRTRIYPIPANGCRTVIVAYEQELHQGSKHALLYSLPMQFNYPIKEFSSSFKVFSSAMPEVGSDCKTGLKFDTLRNVFQATTKNTNFKPNGSFQLMMPILENQAGVMMQQVDGQYYFMINTFPTEKLQDKKMPSAISIVWDVSLSGRLRNHQKEFDLLDKYLKQAGNVKVNLLTLGLQLAPAGQFSVSGGDWGSLKKAIEALYYDGATNFSAFRQNLPGEETLFFTDGLNTWGKVEEIGFAATPVYTISAAGNADYELLRLIAAKTGGVFINLNETTPDEALTTLTRLPLQLINIRTGGMVSEVYPSIATPVQGNCAITGISSTPQTEIVLEFGYGKTVAFTQTVKLDFSTTQVQQIPLDKIWAQKKIAQLNMQFEVFKNLVTSLGKKYGIVTRNTSLIVLDDVADYVKYDIEPPAELKAEYTHLMNQKKTDELKIKNRSIDDALKVYSEVATWWDKDFKPVRRIIRYVDLSVDTAAPMNTITGHVLSDKGEPLPGATVMIKGKRVATAAANDGKFLLQRSGDIVLQASYVGYHVVEIPVPAGINSVNITLDPSGQVLEEVVIVTANSLGYRDGDGVTARADSTRTVSGATDALRRNPAVQMDQAISGSVPGVSVNNAATIVTTAYGVSRSQAPLTVTERSRSGKQKRKGKKKDATGAGSYTYMLGTEADAGDAGIFRGNGFNAAQSRPASQNEDISYAWTNDDRTSGRVRVVTTAVPFLRIDSNARAGTMQFLNADTISGSEGAKAGEMDLIDFSPKRIYLAAMDSAAISGNAYARYIELRKDYEDIPAFYFDMSNYFLKKGDTATGIKILSGIADLGIENHELFKTLGYQLKLLGLYDEEINVFKKVLEWRPQEPQSYRDYALALSDVGRYQQAIDTLYTALLKNYDGEIAALYPGIEEIILTEINNLLAVKKGATSKISKEAVKNMAVDVRVVLNWNMNDTDIDLWVIDPNEEKCFYSQRVTAAGGRISKDFTRGYGPEQFMVKKALKGKYKVMLHYYGDRQQKIAGPTTVMAEIYLNYGKPNQERKLVTLQMEKEGKAGIPVAEFSFE